MIRVLTILGTRPEAIKLAPVLHELQRLPDAFESIVVTTGQHREMLDPMLDLFGIEPALDLQLMTHNQTHGDVTVRALAGLQPILAELHADWVLVQGDTTSVMAACLAAFYGKVRIAHVEAGLRTYSKSSPFPEEVNRRIAGLLADLHFAPTTLARANLLREGVHADHIHVTGNTVVDAMHHVRQLDFDPTRSRLAFLPSDKRLVVVTAHRRENMGFRMESIATAVRDIAISHDDIHVVYPLHMNPRARCHAVARLADLPNVSLFEPLEYQEMVWLLNRAHLVVTDSGGLQEEAAAAQTPVLVLRESTERPEGIAAGIAQLVQPNHLTIVQAMARLLDDDTEHARMASSRSPYGDGRAAFRIVSAIREHTESLEFLHDDYSETKRTMDDAPFGGDYARFAEHGRTKSQRGG